MPNQEQNPPSPSDERRWLIQAIPRMLGHLNQRISEIHSLTSQGAVDPSTLDVVMAHIVITGNVLKEIHELAVAEEQQLLNLVIAKNPGLVDQDGNPLSRPARRKIEREVQDATQKEGENPQELHTTDA